MRLSCDDREFPNLTCPDSLKLSINDTVSREVNLTQHITSNSRLSNIPSVMVNFSTYGQTKNYRVSSTNDMNMTSSCAFQVEIAATKCFEQILNSLTNADVSYTHNADGTVNSTTVTCKPGFAFSDGNTSLQYQCTGENMWTPALPLIDCIATKCFEQIQNSLTNADVSHTHNADGTVDSTTVTCKPGFAFSDGNTSLQYQCTGENMWTPALPLIDCIEYKESIYTFVINVVYGSKQILNDACVSEHNNLVQQVVAADNTLGDLCRKAFRVYYSFNVSSIQTSNTFYKLNSTLVLEVLDFDGDTGNMATCAEDIDKYYQNIFKYTTHTSCGSINASGGEGFLKKGSSCDTRFQLVTVSGSPKCLPCSPGTYFSNEACHLCADGEYQDTTGATSCKSCTDNKASLTPRISEDRCIYRCIDGFFSSTGLPPCTACPVDTYWKNSSFCEPCPNDGSTLHNEASKIESACKVDYA
ncbi:sushi, von Willebrand factor type A, EGF and pentraxin domain-containing protein 1-like [Gigantopelta aegis]|uniref:sushi, von Willebrand factor type A, EGF and pentraxin domain-containing protein 1-like n=1 Tax=Gigantopelta aegis TaxID=1735272 RepID=UPI001B8884D1|nr:sushi, von Willebrand factor type A, EGF and pentraxin domain-containing protein 1-like [Gigantopelta aegis]